jgi:REP element-mobilizing transposase RayT
MSTYLSLHYHVVFSTKYRAASLDAKWRHRLFEYMGGTIRGLGGYPQGVNGWVDHVHLLFGLKATHVLADVVREIKKASSIWVRDEIRLAGFRWQEGYGAFTVGYRERDRIKAYIANQEDHHETRTYLEEVEALYREADIEFDPKYLV